MVTACAAAGLRPWAGGPARARSWLQPCPADPVARPAEKYLSDFPAVAITVPLLPTTPRGNAIDADTPAFALHQGRARQAIDALFDGPAPNHLPGLDRELRKP